MKVNLYTGTPGFQTFVATVTLDYAPRVGEYLRLDAPASIKSYKIHNVTWYVSLERYPTELIVFMDEI